jgi:hypothetical protein
MTRGGKRTGAGRKFGSDLTKKLLVHLTEEQHKAVLERGGAPYVRSLIVKDKPKD